MKVLRALPLALVLSGYSSYSYSDVVNGVTNNAAAGNTFRWDMSNVLPPQAGLTVGGIRYRYTVEKDPTADLSVTVQNEDAINGGYVFQNTDTWDGLPGNTLVKTFPLNNILIDRMGDGSIVTEGDGIVTDADVRYSYTYDECYNPMSDPDCPGYGEAYLAYLLELGLLDLDGPDYNPDEVLSLLSDDETELEDEEGEEETEEEEEEEQEEDMEKLLAISEGVNELADEVAQGDMLLALTRIDQIQSYLDLELNGGSYEEEIQLIDATISDNRGAAVGMGIAQDQKHEEMMSAQYD